METMAWTTEDEFKARMEWSKEVGRRYGYLMWHGSLEGYNDWVRIRELHEKIAKDIAERDNK